MNTKLRALFETIGPGSPARYLSDTETLRLTVFNAASGVRVALRGRKVDENGESKFASNEITPTTARAASIGDVQPGAGWLVGAAALVVAGAPLDGQTYAVLSIGIGIGGQFTETEVLAAGTISAAKRIAWPGSPIVGPLDGAGAVRIITTTVPAAGAEISETVPTGARWQVLAFAARLTTSATVLNRVALLAFDDGAGNRFYGAQANQVQPQSAGYDYSWGTFGAQHAFVTTANDMITLPDLILPSGSRFRTATAGLQVGDQWNTSFYVVRELIEGN